MTPRFAVIVLISTHLAVVLPSASTTANATDTNSATPTTTIPPTTSTTATTPEPTTTTTTTPTTPTTPTPTTTTTPTPTTTTTTTTTTPTTTLPPAIGSTCASPSQACSDIKAKCRKVNDSTSPADYECLCYLEWHESNGSCVKYSTSELGKPHVTNVTETTIALEWREIQLDDRSLTRRYFVRWTPLDLNTGVRIASQQIASNQTVTGDPLSVNETSQPSLIPGVKYSISVNLNISDGDQNSTVVPYKEITHRTAVSQVGSCNTSTYTDYEESGSGIIQMVPPDGRFDNCTAVVYRIDDKSQVESKSFNCQQLELTVDRGVNYSAKIVTYSGQGTSLEKQCRFQFPLPKPEAVSSLIVTPEGKSAKVEWKPPQHQLKYVIGYYVSLARTDPNACNKSYIIISSTNRQRILDEIKLESKVDCLSLEPEDVQEDMDSIDISNLSPYTNYTVKVFAINKAGSGEMKASSFRTKAVVPLKVDVPSTLVINATTIEVTWSKPNVYPGPTNYTLTISSEQSGSNEYPLSGPFSEGKSKQLGEKPIEVTGYNNTSYMVSGLSPHTEYSFTVTANTEVGSSEPSDSAKNTTLESAPGKVISVSVTNTTNTSFDLAWSVPDAINGVLKAYVISAIPTEMEPNENKTCEILIIGSSDITYDQDDVMCKNERRRNRTQWDPSNSNQTVSVTELPPFTNYSVTVVAYNGAGKGDPSEILYAKTNSSASDIVQDVHFQNVTSNSFELTWEKPAHINGILEAYVIIVETTDPNGKGVCIVVKDRQTGPDLNEVSQDFCKRGQIKHVTLKQDQAKVLTDLEPFTNYTVTIVAYNGAGKGKPFKTTVKTNSSASEPVQEVVIKNMTSKSFELTWVKPAHINGILEAYVVFVQSTNPDNEEDVCIVTKDRQTSPDFRDVAGDFCRTSTVVKPATWEQSQPKIVTDLKPFTNYRVTIVAYNGAGKGEPYTTTIKTNSSASEPVQEVDIKNVTSKSFELTWVEPAHINGILEAYVVFVQSTSSDMEEDVCIVVKDRDTNPDFKDVAEDFCRTSTVVKPAPWNHNQPKIVSDLKPFTNYTVTIVAYNGAGKGEPYTTAIKTNSSASDPVSEVVIKDVTSNSFELTWKQPAHINGILKAYVIFVQSTISDMEEDVCIVITDNGNDPDFNKYDVQDFCQSSSNMRYLRYDQPKNVTGLKPFTNYTIAIVAYNGAGKGKSFKTTVKTNSSQSEEIRELNVTQITSTAFTVTWKPPSNINGILKAYVIYIKYQGSEDDQCLAKTVRPKGSSFVWRDEEETQCETFQRTTLAIEDLSDLSVNVSEIYPYMKYHLTVVTYNDYGKGRVKDPVTFSTKIAVPGEVSELVCKNTEIGQLQIVWKPPKIMPGPTKYLVSISEAKHPPDSPIEWKTTKPRNVDGYDNPTTLFTNLRSYWFYNIEVKAQTEKGSSLAVTTQNPCLTLISAPGKVDKFDVQPINGTANRIKVVWFCPPESERNGLIEEFRLEIKPVDSLRVDMKLSDLKMNTTIKLAREGVDGCNSEYYVELTVIPEIKYTFKIQTKVKDLEEYGKESTRNQTIQAGVPPSMSSLAESPIKDPKVPKAQRNEKSFDVSICAKCLLDSSQGRIIDFGIIVCSEKFCDQGNLPLSGESKVDLKGWNDAKSNSFQVPYVVKSDAWEKVIRDGANGMVRFSVGNDTACDSTFCNGPLPSDTTFKVIVYSCTTAGCSVSKLVGPFVTAAAPTAPFPVAAIAGASGGVVSVIIIIIIIFIVRRRLPNKSKTKERKQVRSVYKEEIELGVTLVKEERPIKICDFANQLHNFEQNGNDFVYREFEELVHGSPSHSTDVGSDPQYKPDNRWTNIIPFDHSRVKLTTDRNLPEGKDYINANYIPGLKSAHEYIATQGPLTKTIPQFWTMVWQRNISVIVMLSDFQEPDPRTAMMREKVARYYLDEEESSQFKCGETLEVTRTGKVDNAVWEIRTLKLTNNAEKKSRFVKHFFFKKWTDHAADISPANLLEFVNVVRGETKQKPEAPLLVHCSAGVGRTGTFLAADYFTNFFNSLPEDIDESDFLQRSVDIFGRVLHMRNYRKIMVQTKVQFHFIYQVVHELIKKKMAVFETDSAYCHDYANMEDECGNEPIYANINVSPAGISQPMTDTVDSNDGKTEEYEFIQSSPGQDSELGGQTHQF